MATEGSAKASRHGVMDDELPRRLRAERERRRISVRELARRLDVTPSAISQIETGRARPSVATLFAIVTELGMSLDALFDHDVGGGGRAEQGLGRVIVRESEREALDLSTGVRWERLTADADPDVDFLYVTYDVGGASSPPGRLMRHAGREYGLILSGRLEVTVGFETRELGPGDSLSFDSTTPHRLANRGDEPATSVWVVIGRHGSDPRTEGFAQ
ncbi:MAG: helix-turn-helix transcriptional regulator [Solirubrobacteraceae bacterium]|nr:helix-turn-helix transcriptional regulator [Solirubrobacteraceae bacterium]